MNELATFRHLLIEVSCDQVDHPICFERSTTLPDEKVRWAALEAAATVCRNGTAEHRETHQVTLTEIPETSTGARRA